MIRPILAAWLLIAAFMAAAPSETEARWYYSSTYRSGYSYYPSGSYGTSYAYPSGYYYYEQPQVYVAQYIQYVPVQAVFSTYQPQAVQQYQTTALTQVTQLQRTVTAPAAAVGVQQTVGVQQQQGVDGTAYAAICKAHADLMEARFEARFTRLETAINRAVAPVQAEAPVPQQQRKVEAPQQQSAKVPDGLAVMVNRCAKCHDPASAKDKGGSFVYFDEKKQLTLTDKTLASTYRQIVNGKMPKDAPLTETEVRAVLTYLDAYRPEAVDAKKE